MSARDDRAGRVQETNYSLIRANWLVERGQERIARTCARIRDSLFTLLVSPTLYAADQRDGGIDEGPDGR